MITHVGRRAHGPRNTAVRMAGLLATGLVSAGLALGITSTSAFASSSDHPGEGSSYRQTDVIPIPTKGSPLFADIIYGDQRTHRVYLSDLANSTLDVIDGRRLTLLAQVPGFTNGPAGVLADGHGQVWAGDGAGAVKVVSAAAPYRVIDSVPVGAPTADEIGYDPVDRIIAVTSPDATTAGKPTPWVTLISARPGPHDRHRVLGHVVIPGAGADSIEQPQWDPGTRTFVEAVRSTNDLPSGAVVHIDPRRARLESLMPVDEQCHPGGLAVGPRGRLLLGCNDGAPVLLDSATGRILATYSGHDAGGADEVWFNSADDRFYAAEAGAAGPPPLPQLYPPTVMVIDAGTEHFVTDIRLGSTGLGFHQVTAIGDPARVFVPESDGVHVYTAASRR